MDIAFIDIDGVLADSSARETTAKQVAESGDAFWQTFFLPELVAKDQPIAGIENDYYHLTVTHIDRPDFFVFLLTSRPEHLREATVAWLDRHHIWRNNPLHVDRLLMKPASQQYVKTVVWKAGVVEMMARLYDSEQIVFVDDEQSNREAVQRLQLPCTINVAASLAEAVQQYVLLPSEREEQE